MNKFVVIEGNIGVGKTSLATMLSEDWNTKLLLEEFEDNEFLNDFYKPDFSEHLQTELHFLLARFKQLTKKLEGNGAFVSDYFVEKCLIFAELNLKSSDFRLFREVYEIVLSKVKRPDLYVFLNADVNHIKRNILKRGRKIERTIDTDYLEKVAKGYLKYVSSHKDLTHLIIDVSQMDFVNQPQHYQQIKNSILKKLDSDSLILS